MSKKRDAKVSTEAILEKFKQLRMPAAAEQYLKQLGSPEAATKDFIERLDDLLTCEIQSRTHKRRQKFLKESHIGVDPMPALERTLLNADRGVSLSFLKELGKCHWIESEQHPWLLITGQSGTGKTWLAKALTRAAIENDLRALYLRTREILDSIELAQEDKRFDKYANSLNRFDLLVLDDFNLLKTSDEIRSGLLEIVDQRWDKKAMIITSQYPVDQWYEYVGGPGDQRDAFMDRIVNGSYHIGLKGKSLREMRRLEQIE